MIKGLNFFLFTCLGERTGAKIHTVKVLGYIASQIVSTAKANEQLLRSTGAYLAEIHNGLAVSSVELPVSEHGTLVTQ